MVLLILPVYRLIFLLKVRSLMSMLKGGEGAYRAASVKGKIALVDSGGG